MTDAPGNAGCGQAARRPGKRERLVAAASELLHQQSVEKMTLADIGRLADVPLGNVYYYFRTKDEIVETVIETMLKDIQAEVDSLERRYHHPKARPKAPMAGVGGIRPVAGGGLRAARARAPRSVRARHTVRRGRAAVRLAQCRRR
jgi:AcrR family transcriptional regulator